MLLFARRNPGALDDPGLTGIADTDIRKYRRQPQKKRNEIQVGGKRDIERGAYTYLHACPTLVCFCNAKKNLSHRGTKPTLVTIVSCSWNYST